MLACFRSGVRSPTTSNKFPPFLTTKISSLSQNLTLNMSNQPTSKRPTCPNCAKPIALCLCTRLKTPNLDNKVHVTILQHSLEKKHPLNSAKIAKLGLKNVDVYTVADVNFEAQFDIWPLELGLLSGLSEVECTPAVCGNAPESVERVDSVEPDGGLSVGRCRKRGFDQVAELDLGAVSVKVADSNRVSDCSRKDIDESGGFEGSREQSDAEVRNDHGNLVSNDAMTLNGGPLMSITIGKYGSIICVSHQLKLQDEEKRPKLEHLIACQETLKHVAGGFVVKKMQKKQISGSVEFEEVEEFKFTVPAGSTVLFPAENAVPVKAIDFVVKNLIVLDGTWAKAKRVYAESPWLRMLPCVRLDSEKTSLFGEVRQEPKPGYLSTIESIVYALEGFGETENLEGLHNLLEVFESMVADQRRYKEDSVKKLSST